MTTTNKWQFWIDRGGTFTDIVACDPQGDIKTHKLLSENPQHYQDAAIQGVRDLLSIEPQQSIPVDSIQVVRMGTTVATNALLEHAGEPLLLLVTKGFRDALRIAYQQRPDLFALDIVLPEMLYEKVVEIEERVKANGEVDRALNLSQAKQELQAAYAKGLRSVAIVFMHAYRYPDHENQLAQLAADIGFPQISTSHQTSPLIRYISRGDTTVVDAYLSPILRRYVMQVEAELPNIPLLFMQSSGGLTHANHFQGKDAILSGPAGGVVGMIQTAKEAGFSRLIGFDMGGTSTDVCHYQGEFERTMDTQIAGVRISAPMMRIHTVAAGGGSILHYDNNRFRVGPDSAGANPGPVAYRAGGVLTITDCNVLLGKLQADFFPKLFGSNADLPLDNETVKTQFSQLAKDAMCKRGRTGRDTRGQTKEQTSEQIAEGFLTIAVENMANAIKKISVQRGYDVTNHTLCCFGGAGGQHACLVADALGIESIFLHEYSGVLSAYGMGLADIRKIRQQSLDVVLEPSNAAVIQQLLRDLAAQARQDVDDQLIGRLGVQSVGQLVDGIEQIVSFKHTLQCKYEGSDSTLEVNCENKQTECIIDNMEALEQHFTHLHQQQFGFTNPQKPIVVASVEVEAIAGEKKPFVDEKKPLANENLTGAKALEHVENDEQLIALAHKPVYMQGKWQQVPFYRRVSIPVGTPVHGPAVILETTGTVVIEACWSAVLRNKSQLVLTRSQTKVQTALPETMRTATKPIVSPAVSPVMLEVFNNLFMSIAEQMGFVLEKTAVSVNIKERLDFSCAIFDAEGDLVANAPHMPVHLGSMSESIKAVIRNNSDSILSGDVFMLNDPYNGGTHLPDITIIKPVFSHEVGGKQEDGDNDKDTHKIIFYVAARGHHADIGGISPGSIPPDSQTIDEEGILIDNFKLVEAGEFQETAVRRLLLSGHYPVRNIDYNIADLKAQLAACEKGTIELGKIISRYSLAVVQAYMCYVQDNAEESVRCVIASLHNGQFSYQMDDGCQIKVSITVDTQSREACIDFTGTSAQHKSNLNAPTAITKAAVLYVFRTLVEDDIPLNEGCLKPLNIIIPENCMLNPSYPAAVVAGNVETSQYIVDALYGALGTMAASQGTMNNVTWGNEYYQYYETLCGGAGATADSKGADAVHTHMTNSRLTDPEVLEQRFPVMLDEFSIRKNSAGQGLHKGGQGVVRKTRFLDSMMVNILSGHRRIPPYGMAGGEEGQTGENLLVRANGEIEQLSFKDKIEVGSNDVLVIKTPGGGGYG